LAICKRRADKEGKGIQKRQGSAVPDGRVGRGPQKGSAKKNTRTTTEESDSKPAMHRETEQKGKGRRPRSRVLDSIKQMDEDALGVRKA